MDVTVAEHGSGRAALRPLVRPAGVGALLGLGWLLLLVLPWDSDDLCRSEEPWGCLGVGLLLLGTVPAAAALLGWGLLRIAGVRPAWRVAAAGALLGVLAAVLWSRASGGTPGGTVAMPLLLAAAYAVAAAVALPGAGSLRRWGVLAAAVLLLWPLSGVLGSQRLAEGRTAELAGSPVPLLAPEVDGYRIHFASGGKHTDTFRYLLLPPSVQTGAADREEHGIWVTVAPPVAGFAPPGVCEVDMTSGRLDAAPCEQVAPETWRSSRNGNTTYIARRQGVIVALSTIGPRVPDRDLRAIADSLAVRSPGFFG
ncbi:hypothetical protein DEJ50_30840 [Streptomyces venezuelae]|uniref:Uncharacterized protein n=1 Tax=Streptomyces venezuelae TaxID=54571 RepID=A0A5P2DEA9_STRVZ|nr:hypothetical protein [Streptomyces venezuelae]QES51591.1 hypothetical protein DEJ50_30840 [Streptomyces venezuelae]